MTKLHELLDPPGVDTDAWKAFGHLIRAHMSLLEAWEIMGKMVFTKRPQPPEDKSCPAPDAVVADSASAGTEPSAEA